MSTFYDKLVYNVIANRDNKIIKEFLSYFDDDPLNAVTAIMQFQGILIKLNAAIIIDEPIEWLTHFSKEQIKYICSLSMLDSKLIACAGSGKTRTILARIRFLLENNIYKKNEVYAITFSKASANDFKRKLITLFPGVNLFNMNNFCTIDSLAKKLLMKFNVENSSNVELLSLCLKNYLFECDDKQFESIKLLFPIKQLFVDEAQDLSETQYGIISILKEKLGCSVSLIGDPNQNIFQFRGSSDSFLLNYDAPLFYLTANYRSTQQIIDFSEGLKPIISPPSLSGLNLVGEKVKVMYENHSNIHKKILSELKNWKPEDVAIIAPTKGTKQNSTGLSGIYDLLILNGYHVNQLYNESGDFSIEKNVREGEINLLTYHGTKGLEFKFVIVLDFYQFLFNIQPDEKEHLEKRYLLYVACSRAIEKMWIVAYSDIGNGMNCWLRKVNPCHYECNDLLIPKLSYRKIIKQQINNINEIIINMNEHQIHQIYSLLKINTYKNKKDIKLYPQYQIEGKDDRTFLSRFMKVLFFTQYDLFNKVSPEHMGLIDHLLMLDVLIVNDERLKAVIQNVIFTTQTWQAYDNIKHDLNYPIREFFDKLDRNIELSDIYLISDRERIILIDNIDNIKRAYTHYLNPESYDWDYKNIISDLFYLVLICYSYDISHFSHIIDLGESKRDILNHADLFESVNQAIVSHYGNKNIDRYVRIEHKKCKMTSMIDFIHNDMIYDIKACNEINIRHYIHLFMCNHINNENKLYGSRFKIINLLTGIEHTCHISIDKKDMWTVLRIMAEVGNLQFENVNVIYDLETTGFIGKNNNYPDIVEVSMVEYETEMPIFDTLINPLKQIHPAASKKNGITKDILNNAPVLSKAINDWHRSAKVLLRPKMIAYNGSTFDDKIVKHHQFFRYCDPVFLDAMTIITKIYERGSLSTIYEKLFGKTFDAHRSLADVIATIEIMKELNINF